MVTHVEVALDLFVGVIFEINKYILERQLLPPASTMSKEVCKVLLELLLRQYGIVVDRYVSIVHN